MTLTDRDREMIRLGARYWLSSGCDSNLADDEIAAKVEETVAAIEKGWTG